MQLLGVVGALILVLANYDALATTLAVGSGTRPLTARVTNLLRSGLRRVPRLLPIGGPLVVLTTVSVWIGLLWAGYSCLFLADDSAIAHATTGEPASAVSRIYYAGYTLFTLGNGGYAPEVGFWEILTVVGALNGLFVVTLSITYLLPIVSAAVERRQLAILVHGLGDTAEKVVVAAFDGADLSYLGQQLPTISQQLILTAERHLAYPVLHDFRSSDPGGASERVLVLLDEVVTLLQHGVAEGMRPPSPVLLTARHAIDEVRQRMPFDGRVDEAPPPPDLDHLAARGIPVVARAEFLAAVHSLADRRRHLAAILDAAAWSWPTLGAAPGGRGR